MAVVEVFTGEMVVAMGSRACHVVRLGLVEYQRAWDLQRQLVERVHQGEQPDTLLLLEHPHVYTLGRSGQASQVLVGPDQLARLGASLFWVDRGGESTYHGPGQLVGYPVVNIRGWGGPIQYVRTLEQIIVDTLADFGIRAGTVPGLTGVWVGQEKIAAIGVKVSRGITSHGFALNVNTDLSYFQYIIPCGIQDRGVTSMARLLDRPVDVDEVCQHLVWYFGRRMGMEMVRVDGGRGQVPWLGYLQGLSADTVSDKAAGAD